MLLRAVAAYDGGELVRAIAVLDSLPETLSARDRAIHLLYRGLIRFAEGDLLAADASFRRALEADPAVRLDPRSHSPSRIRAFDAARDTVVAAWRSEARRTDAAGEWEIALQRWEAVLAAFPDDDEARVRARIVRNRLAVPPAGSERISPPPPPPPAADPDSAALANVRLYSPGGAMMMGMVVPGLGEFYTGRTGRGLLYLLAAGGAAAAGVLYTNVEVRCLSVPVDGTCPPADIISETTERPWLGAGLGAAAAITFAGAIDALIGAQRMNARARAAALRQSRSGLTLEGPVLRVSARDLRLAFVRLRF